jgi:aromatic ring-opening dioxygenase catalytic subunit (LigB family)
MAAKQPTFFLPHGGGPCFFMDWDPPDTFTRLEAFLRGLIATLPERPKAVLLVTAHWEAPAFTVSNAAHHPLLFDYYGFPPHTYELTYPAPGDPALAQRVRDLLGKAGIASAADAERGWDHGTFVPLKVVLPDGDVPIVQMSLKAGFDPEAHLAAGRALAPLRDEAVLIAGSGMSFHDLRLFGQPAAGPISERFDHWLTEAVESVPAKRDAALAHWADAPAGRQSHPREEHLIPLLVAAGAAGDDMGRTVFTDRLMNVTISGHRFG